MISIPFVYFFGLFILCYRRYGFFSIGTYIVGLYMLISFASIILDKYDYYAASCKNLGLDIFSTVLYCVLLTVCIIPYATHSFKNFNPYISSHGNRLLKLMTYGYACIFFIILLVSFTRINEVILSNSLAEIRNEQYTGGTVSFYDHLSGIPRYICAICSILAPSAYIMTLIFFYNIAYLKRSLIFNILTIMGSMSQLLIAINIADRSNFAYWFLLIGLGISIFYNKLPTKKRIYIGIILSSIGTLFLIYFIAVSVSRFEQRSGGTLGGIFLYAGQSFINFCNFINNVDSGKSLCEIFPFINQLLGGEGYFEVAEKVESMNHNGIMISSFSTFLGYIYSISGWLVLILFIIFYNIVSSLVTSHRVYYIGDIIRIWSLSLVLVLGLFCYFYSFSNNTLALIFWFIIASLLSKHKNKQTTKINPIKE